MFGIIYCAISLSGKKYIGQTTRGLYKRVKDHINEAHNKKRKGYNSAFKRAIRKYGDKITWTILYENIPIEYLNIMEKITINWYNSFEKGYNRDLGGNTQKPTEETRKKQSLALKGKKRSEETKAHIRELRKDRPGSMKGKKHKEENKPKFGRKKEDHHLWNKERPDKTKEKISKTRIERNYKGDNNPVWGLNSDDTEKQRLRKISSENTIGEKNPMAKYTAKDIITIKLHFRNEKITYYKLGKIYNIDQKVIRKFIMGQSWKHITNEYIIKYIEEGGEVNLPLPKEALLKLARDERSANSTSFSVLNYEWAVKISAQIGLVGYNT